LQEAGRHLIGLPVPFATAEVVMKFLAVLVAICGLSQTAMAQTPACKSIADTAQRLACYDKASPPTAQSAPAMSKPDAGKYVDTIGAEDTLMNAKLKNICRGC
jgi:hypothetical protein